MQEGTQIRHASDEEFSLALMEGEETLPHLESCPACHGETQRVRRALGGFAEAARAEAERPESDWAQQRATITERNERYASATRRLVWAAAAASLVLAAHLALEQARRIEPTAQVDPDSVLLYEVRRAVDREFPAAFEPARLLTQEMSRAAQTQASSDRTKEGEKK